MPSLQKRIPMYITLPVAVAAVVVVPAASQKSPPAYYTIVPDPVTGNRAAGINGSFKIVGTPVLDTGSVPTVVHAGIVSDRTGGACFVFRAKDLGYSVMAGKQCTMQSDCEIPTEGGGAGYCETKTKTCWSRPVRTRRRPVQTASDRSLAGGHRQPNQRLSCFARQSARCGECAGPRHRMLEALQG